MKLQLLDLAALEEAAIRTNMNVDVIRRARDDRFELSLGEERNWLFDLFNSGVELSAADGTRYVRFKVFGLPVPRSTFETVYGFEQNNSRISELIKKALDPEIHRATPPKVPAAPQGLRWSKTESYMAAWLMCFISLFADQQPNKEASHLDPVGHNEVWRQYKDNCMLCGKGSLVGDSNTLNRVWNNRYLKQKLVTIRKHKGVKGGICLDCGEIKMMGLKARTFEDKQKYIAENIAHRNFHGMERQLQQSRKLDVQDDPTRKDQIYFDIWDMNGTIVPRTAMGSIDGAVGHSKANSIKNRVQGIFFAGKEQDQKLYLYKSFDTVKKGANLTCTQLTDAIRRRGRGLAPTVNFEIDGGSENQNITVLAFYALLLVHDSCNSATASRLPIHHGHNLLDSFFGTGAQGVKGKRGRPGAGGRESAGQGSMSQQDWDRNVARALQSVNCEVVETFAVLDFEKWLAPFIDQRFNGYGPGTPIRVFRVVLGDPTREFPQGQPLIQYKFASQDERWMPSDCPGAPLFKTRPSGSPKLLPLEKWENFSQIKSNILRDSANRLYFTHEHARQWQEWLENAPLSLDDLVAAQTPTWGLPQSRGVAPIFRVTSTRHKEPDLPVKDQPLQWSGHMCRRGTLVQSRAAARGSVAPPPRAVLLDEWHPKQHNSQCEKCSEGGTLICCYSCNLVFHRKCEDTIPNAGLPDVWQCPACVIQEASLEGCCGGAKDSDGDGGGSDSEDENEDADSDGAAGPPPRTRLDNTKKRKCCYTGGYR